MNALKHPLVKHLIHLHAVGGAPLVGKRTSRRFAAVLRDRNITHPHTDELWGIRKRSVTRRSRGSSTQNRRAPSGESEQTRRISHGKRREIRVSRLVAVISSEHDRARFEQS